MDHRIFYSTILTVLVILDIICAVMSLRSKRPVGKAMGLLDLSFVPPILGNLIIIGTSLRPVAIFGYYMYFLGMDCIMASVVNYTNEYCKGTGDGQRKPTVMYLIVIADAVQLLANPFTGHAFDVEPIDVQGLIYYRLVPYFGQTIHRVVDYGVFICVLLIFILTIAKTIRIYREKYTVILIAMLSVAVSQTYFIFSRTPIDRSMIGYGFLGILMTYLSIYYRPLRLLDRMLSDIVSGMPAAMYLYDPDNKCIWANEPGYKLAGVTERELYKVTEKLAEIFGKKGFSDDEWSENHVIGEGSNARYYYVEKRNIKYKKKALAGCYLSVRDDTEEHLRMEREYYNTTHDSLTGLYTKQYMYECIKKKLTEDQDTKYLVIYIDVKNFKIVNDVFGADFGDLAIQQIADRIREDMTEACIYGRLEGDTFGAFMPVMEFNADLLEEKLGNFIIRDGSIEHPLQINAGVYVLSNDDTEVSVMFDRAHLSLSSLKDYKTHVAYYDGNIREKVLESQRLCTELPQAMETMQVRPYLQPIVDREGKVVGAEALVRWIHPINGFMPPVKFVPLFEKNGLIVEVDRHMWRCACRQLAKWKGKHDDVFISVNISPKDFYYIDVVSEIKALVKEYDIEPVKLRLEITETVMMNGADDRMKMLEELREAGFIVEMDDFGSGYSSLNLLKDMPVDVLKIDMEFLSGDEDNGRSDTIIKHIIKMTEELDMSSLTEGVETSGQFKQLTKMGCRLFQGYYFAKPMPVEEFEIFAFDKEDK
ncbi:MAG: EAL domain-containing protein [Lachnospiraceae bacterium]|nr:EAL domain-containing protein [Lachnospiraceae bacterium]